MYIHDFSSLWVVKKDPPPPLINLYINSVNRLFNTGRIGNLNRHVNGSQIFQCHGPTTATNSYVLLMINLLIMNLLIFTVLEKMSITIPS